MRIVWDFVVFLKKGVHVWSAVAGRSGQDLDSFKQMWRFGRRDTTAYCCKNTLNLEMQYIGSDEASFVCSKDVLVKSGHSHGDWALFIPVEAAQWRMKPKWLDKNTQFFSSVLLGQYSVRTRDFDDQAG